MNAQIVRFLFLGFLTAFVGWPPNGAEAPDFTGQYTLTKSAAPKKDRRTGTLSVTQTADHVLITRTWSDRRGASRESNSFPLDGQEIIYTSPGGVKGKGSVEFKGRDLLLRVVTVGRSDPSQPPVEIIRTEQWELSKDLKTLTVQTSFHFPSVPILAPILDTSTTEKYTRE